YAVLLLPGLFREEIRDIHVEAMEIDPQAVFSGLADDRRAHGFDVELRRLFRILGLDVHVIHLERHDLSLATVKVKGKGVIPPSEGRGYPSCDPMLIPL